VKPSRRVRPRRALPPAGPQLNKIDPRLSNNDPRLSNNMELAVLRVDLGDVNASA
jgi:hypothetical protein